MLLSFGNRRTSKLVTSAMTRNPEKHRPFCRGSLAQRGLRHESSFIFFSGHERDRAESEDRAVLSNWYVLDKPFLNSEGSEFHSAKQYIVYGKAILFGDLEMSKNILRCASPAAAKGLGRKVRDFDEDVWAAKRISIATDGCELKFSQSDACKEVLLGTGDKLLVEIAPGSKLCGIGMQSSDPKKIDPSSWKGENMGGDVLMTVRERLRTSAASLIEKFGGGF